MTTVNIGSVVSRQVPEFIREDYPGFVAFVEAYYQYLQTQQVDLSSARDLDKTLDEFIKYFKKELSINLPFVPSDERFYLERIRDQYLAKGSEASYKLLFKILYGKDVQLFYPGEQMLRPSDGHWNQDSSIFAQVTYGDPETIIGKVVTIEEGNKIIRVQVNKKLELTGEIDRIVALGGNVYEFFLDKKIYGKVNPGNIIKYGTEFKATILPTTSNLNIYDAGQGFRVGQVFEVKSSTGTGTLIKVTKVNDNGGIKYAQIIKFGVGYLADFTASILPSDSLTSKTITTTDQNFTPITFTTSGGNLIVGLEPKIKVSELGFINKVDYIDPDYVDGSYAGTILKEFFFESKTIQQGNIKPAIVEINLAAIAKYPGYYEDNSGFLSDSIYIQDSKYYQIFSYVIKIDERLKNYKAAVKSMIHPAGMALFGEYEITNNITLTETLESIVKFLTLGFLEVPLETEEVFYWHWFKDLSSNNAIMVEPFENNFVGGATSVLHSTISKPFNDDITATQDSVALNINLGKTEELSIGDTNLVVAIGVNRADSFSFTESLTTNLGLSATDSDEIEETLLNITLNGNNKYLVLPQQNIRETEFGYVVLNAYEEGNYFNEIYVNNRDAVFSS